MYNNPVASLSMTSRQTIQPVIDLVFTNISTDDVDSEFTRTNTWINVENNGISCAGAFKEFALVNMLSEQQF